MSVSRSLCLLIILSENCGEHLSKEKEKKKENTLIRMMKLLVGQMYINDELVLWP